MCRNNRTGQPVEVERTAFIAFIEKEQVRKAPCISNFFLFSLQILKVVLHFPIAYYLSTILQPDDKKERWGVLYGKVRTLCVTIQEVDGLRTSNGIQYRLQLLYSNGEPHNFLWILGLQIRGLPNPPLRTDSVNKFLTPSLK